MKELLDQVHQLAAVVAGWCVVLAWWLTQWAHDAPEGKRR